MEKPIPQLPFIGPIKNSSCPNGEVLFNEPTAGQPWCAGVRLGTDVSWHSPHLTALSLDFGWSIFNDLYSSYCIKYKLVEFQ